MNIVRLRDAQVSTQTSPLKKSSNSSPIKSSRWDWYDLELSVIQVAMTVANQQKTYIEYQGISLVYWYKQLGPEEVWDELIELLAWNNTS